MLADRLSDKNIAIQYCPPGQHRANSAERSIQTFKNHAIATLATTDPTFPLALWDTLLPQMELCINHLLPFKPNPSISAYAGIHGASHDFRAHPIAPAGIKVLNHDKPSSRASWASHGTSGFYIGPAIQHYRCYNVYVTATATTRVTDTVQWFPHNFFMPDPTPHDNALAAIADLSASLKRLSALPLPAHTMPQPTLPSTIAEQLKDLLHMYSPSLQPDHPTIHDITSGIAAATCKQHTLSDVILAPTPAPEQRVLTPRPEQRVLPPRPEQRVLTPQPEQRVLTPLTAPATRSLHSPSIDNTPPALFPLNLAPDGSPLTYHKAKKGPDSTHWLRAEIEELDRLMHSNTIKPITLADQPLDRRGDTTYYNPQTKQKRDVLGQVTYRIRGTAGEDKINYQGPTSALTADMPVVKLLIHSVVSENAKWMTIDIKDYYLGTPLLRPEYVRIPIRLIPDSIVSKHHLSPFIANGSVLFQVSKGMYGLPQAGLLAQERLVKHLASRGYLQTHTPCLFRHTTNGTMFTLVVDDFGIKYTSKAAADHLISTLQELYEIKTNWTGSTYIGFTIRFNPTARTVSLSMPGYIAKVLQRFKTSGSSTAASPAVYISPSYGAPLQAPTTDTSSPLDAAAIKTLQEQVGCLLYYARGIDATILPAVTHISSRQSDPTQAVAAAMDRLLRYCARYPDNELVYHACSMTLEIQSDASYLSRPHARSVAGCLFYLVPPPGKVNGPCHALSSVIPVVVSSVAEAEYGSLFIAGREGAMLRTILTSLGYPQLATTIFCDNACAVSIANDTITPRRTKSIDMHFYWIRDRVRQQQFIVTWVKGTDNLADFFTKALPVHTHRRLMSSLVYTPPNLSSINQPKHSLRRQKYLTPPSP